MFEELKDRLFLVADTAADFLNAYNLGKIKQDDIVFIKDTKSIWSHGVYFASVDSSAINEKTLEQAMREMSSGSLVPGATYIIHGFTNMVKPSYDFTDIRSLGTVYDIITKAVSKNEFSPFVNLVLSSDYEGPIDRNAVLKTQYTIDWHSQSSLRQTIVKENPVEFDNSYNFTGITYFNSSILAVDGTKYLYTIGSEVTSENRFIFNVSYISSSSTVCAFFANSMHTTNQCLWFTNDLENYSSINPPVSGTIYAAAVVDVAADTLIYVFYQNAVYVYSVSENSWTLVNTLTDDYSTISSLKVSEGKLYFVVTISNSSAVRIFDCTESIIEASITEFQDPIISARGSKVYFMDRDDNAIFKREGSLVIQINLSGLDISSRQVQDFVYTGESLFVLFADGSSLTYSQGEQESIESTGEENVLVLTDDINIVAESKMLIFNYVSSQFPAIIRAIDDRGNDFTFDFRDIQFLRYPAQTDNSLYIFSSNTQRFESLQPDLTKPKWFYPLSRIEGTSVVEASAFMHNIKASNLEGIYSNFVVIGESSDIVCSSYRATVISSKDISISEISNAAIVNCSQISSPYLKSAMLRGITDAVFAGTDGFTPVPAGSKSLRINSNRFKVKNQTPVVNLQVDADIEGEALIPDGVFVVRKSTDSSIAIGESFSLQERTKLFYFIDISSINDWVFGDTLPIDF